MVFYIVIPAKAGIHPSTAPAAAMDSRFRGNDGRKKSAGLYTIARVASGG
jgi:hypothetical protein